MIVARVDPQPNSNSTRWPAAAAISEKSRNDTRNGEQKGESVLMPRLAESALSRGKLARDCGRDRR